MESNKKSKFEKVRTDVLSFCFEFLETYELIILREIRNRFLRKILYTKKLPEYITKILKSTQRTNQEFDFPPQCIHKDNKKHLKISMLCQKCSNFICDIGFDKCLKENSNKSLSFYTCKDKKHNGSRKMIDNNCLSCKSILCHNCVINHRPGEILHIENLKKFLKDKENQKIEELRTLAYSYITFINSLDSFIQDTVNSFNKQYNSELKNLHIELCPADIKAGFKKTLKTRLEKVLTSIILKIYDTYSLKELKLDKEQYKTQYYATLKKRLRIILFSNDKYSKDCGCCLGKEKSSTVKCEYCSSTHCIYVKDWSGGPWSGDPESYEYHCLHCEDNFIT